jgi:tRNA(Arg) A34 adenosine deaminase TadA
MTDQQYLQQAIEMSQKSPEPVGCGVLIVQAGDVIAKTHNSQRADRIAVNHAEIKAIIEANKLTSSRKLENAVAYCSCEPCAMCLTALSYAKVSRIVFNKFMKDLFPDDPQSQLNPFEYAKTLNFVPTVEQLDV